MTTYPFRPLRPNQALFTLTMVMILIASACGGKKAPIPPPPPPAPTAGSTNAPSGGSGRPVVAEFTVEPSSIQVGQSAVLRWNVTGSTNVAIDHGLGTVPATGTSRLTPANTTTYLLTATGPAGDTTATTTVTVTGPPLRRRPHGTLQPAEARSNRAFNRIFGTRFSIMIRTTFATTRVRRSPPMPTR
jgi:peptidoglycan-associated lipoprotein